ncbi:ATP-binding protein [Terrarubrum flagellatum]|uniref:ATP-binding protein n=1 Tax=Terrirubrum flagellatum TaxID=2895980 RepID=UPI0031450BC0
MESTLHKGIFDRQIVPEKRDIDQPRDRLVGRVIACDGARATLSCAVAHDASISSDFWAIGRLITIKIDTGRIVGLVYEVSTEAARWDEKAPNIVFVKVELVGEITDRAHGRAKFRRGLLRYPPLGAPAHHTRSSDLAAIYDLGERGGVEIGRLSQDDGIAATVNIHDMLNRHFAVVGTTGVGKSSAVSLLLRRAVMTKPDLRVLVLDPHNEYAHAFSDLSITVDAATLELPFWMFKFEEFADIVFRGRSGLEEEQEILRDMISFAKAKNRSYDAIGASISVLKRPNDATVISTADTPVPYRMLDLIGILDEHIGKLDVQHDRARLRSLRHRLDALNKDQRFRFMFGGSGFEDSMERTIAKIFRLPHEGRPITVFQLAGLPSEVVNAVASVLSRVAFDLAMLSGGAYEILVLCEEAHRYVPQDPNLGFLPTRQAIARIAKEGRKYGCYLGVVTQRPGELDPTILSQCSTVFAMRLGNDRDQEIIRRAIADSSASTIAFLSAIGNREAIAFGEGVATPMRMTFASQERQNLPATSLNADELSVALAPELSARDLANRMRGMAQQAGW